MNVIAFCALFSLLSLLPVLGADAPVPEGNVRRTCAITMKVLEQRMDPVIKRGDPGTEGIKHGIEGGIVLKIGPVYHLFVTEIDGDPEWTKTRIAHWTSENRLRWTRCSTVFNSSGDFSGKDKRASLWAMPVAYDDSAQRWNLFYVSYRSKPNDHSGWYLNHHGQVHRAVSDSQGINGIGGPYRDVGVVLEPCSQSQPWEGLQGADSFHIYRVGKRWMAFYGSAQTQLKPKPNPAYAKWNVGLAEAEAIGGPWTRRPEGNPVFANAENPVVIRLASGRYVTVFDALSDKPLFIGYAESRNGIEWSKPAYLELRHSKEFWTREVRTPLGLIPEADGSFSLFYTGHHSQDPALQAGETPEKGKKPPFPCLGLLSVVLRERR